MEHLFHAGENLDGLGLLIKLGVSVDLVYIDPPFATNNEFLMDSDRANTVSASGQLAYSDTLQIGEYLDQLQLRLNAIRSIMSEDGSIYVHINVNMEHHVRLLMDKVFGHLNFRNSITRIKCNPKNFNRYSYGNVKDTILFYSVSPHRIKWYPQQEPHTGDDLVSRYPLVDDEGRRYATTPLHAPGTTRNGATGGLWRGMPPPLGRHWRYSPEKLDELDETGLIAWSSTGNPRKIIYANHSPGKLPQDVWVYKDPQRPTYPTQKNAAMLERIIRTSSEPGDTVLDCYAGSGSTLLEAARLGRRFIGMDNSSLAQAVMEERLISKKIEWVSVLSVDVNHTTQEQKMMPVPQPPEPLIFEDLEHRQNLANFIQMGEEIPQRSERLATRIAHFSAQFDIPEQDFWRDLEANPNGPLAAVLAREARRQNIHENAAAEYVRQLDNVEVFRKLPSTGPNAQYLNADGQVVTGQQLGQAPRPSKSIDFRWRTGNITCYAAQKYTREGGGNQDNQFNEIERLLRNFLPRINNGTTLLVLVDGPYYTEQRLARLRGFSRNRTPRSYVTSINELQPLLNQIAADGDC